MTAKSRQRKIVHKIKNTKRKQTESERSIPQPGSSKRQATDAGSDHD